MYFGISNGLQFVSNLPSSGSNRCTVSHFKWQNICLLLKNRLSGLTSRHVNAVQAITVVCVWQADGGRWEHSVPLRADGDGAGHLHRSHTHRNESSERLHPPTAHPELLPLLSVHTPGLPAEPPLTSNTSHTHTHNTSAADQHIRLISEGSCDTENTAAHHRNKLHCNIYSHRKLLF